MRKFRSIKMNTYTSKRTGIYWLYKSHYFPINLRCIFVYIILKLHFYKSFIVEFLWLWTCITYWCLNGWKKEHWQCNDHLNHHHWPSTVKQNLNCMNTNDNKNHNCYQKIKSCFVAFWIYSVTNFTNKWQFN